MAPMYNYRCANKHQFDRFYTLREHDSAVSCEECDLVAQQVITAPAMVKVSCDVHYTSPIDGRVIRSHAERHDDLARNGCVPYDPEMKKDVARWEHEKEEAFLSKVEDTAIQQVARLPHRKKAQLKKEVMQQGVGLDTVRNTPF